MAVLFAPGARPWPPLVTSSTARALAVACLLPVALALLGRGAPSLAVLRGPVPRFHPVTGPRTTTTGRRSWGSTPARRPFATPVPASGPTDRRRCLRRAAHRSATEVRGSPPSTNNLSSRVPGPHRRCQWTTRGPSPRFPPVATCCGREHPNPSPGNHRNPGHRPPPRGRSGSWLRAPGSANGSPPGRPGTGVVRHARTGPSGPQTPPRPTERRGSRWSPDTVPLRCLRWALRRLRNLSRGTFVGVDTRTPNVPSLVNQSRPGATQGRHLGRRVWRPAGTDGSLRGRSPPGTAKRPRPPTYGGELGGCAVPRPPPNLRLVFTPTTLPQLAAAEQATSDPRPPLQF